MPQSSSTQIPEPALSRFIFADTKTSIFWLIVRLYIGYEWVVAGWAKVTSPLWFGSTAGGPITGFLMGALKKTSGAHPDVSTWYADFLKSAVIPNAAVFSNAVAVGELLVGVALILGIFTGIAAFFGAFMNMNYLFAGTVSTNPLMFLLQLFLILAWRVAGFYGLDHFVLPYLGAPWHKGKLFNKKS